jgi:5-methylthioadenosine/S-adenosylhomocysteine deaminase
LSAGAKQDGTSVNQFVATAVAEKLVAMSTGEFFAERRARADFTAFDRLMRRKGGEPPAPDDTIRLSCTFNRPVEIGLVALSLESLEIGMAGALSLVLYFIVAFHAACAFANTWAIKGTILTPDDIISSGTIIVSDDRISAIGDNVPIPVNTPTVISEGIILPGFIDLHNHLTWNVFPRWAPSQKFHNRYEWQVTTEYDRALRIPQGRLISNGFGCKANMYAEIKALAGGATSVTGSYLGRTDAEHQCAIGLTRNLDHPSGFQTMASPPCPGQAPLLQAVVANEVFPMEIPYERLDWYRCELTNGTLRALLVHLSEGSPSDASARREFRMLSSHGILGPGLVIVHGTALGLDDFQTMAHRGVGLVWSPRSNDELYGGTTNAAAAMALGVQVAIGPDWSPTGSSGILQELNYIASRHSEFTPKQLVQMVTAIPAKLARLDDRIGKLAPGFVADLVVLKRHGDAPYETVVSATPIDIRLVVVGGTPVYGDRDLMSQLLPGAQFSELNVCGAQKVVALASLSTPVVGGWNELTAELDAELRRYGSMLSAIECN